jgi:nucleoside diphosphate kinase
LEKTLAIIKPDAMIPTIIDQILSMIKWNRFHIVEQKKIWLTKEEAEVFYQEHKGRPFFETLVDFLSSAPVIALKLAKENAVTALRELLGPTNPHRAKDDAPKSIRAQFGTDNMINAMYGADSVESAQKHFEFIDTIAALPMENYAENNSFGPQRSFVIIKPGVNPDDIVKRILWHRYAIIKRNETVLQREQALLIYNGYEDKSYFEDLIEHVISGPSVLLVVKGEDVVTGLKELAGPHDPQEARKISPMSFRALYGENVAVNGVDVSETAEDAAYQIQALFPGYQSRVASMSELRNSISTRRTSIIALESTLALIKPDAYGAGHKDEILSMIKNKGFTIVIQKEFQLTKELAKEFYLEHAEKPFYDTLTTWMSSAPIYAMVLKKENAIKDWRDLAGPTNSELARQVAPQR